jgi:hypothetical protein
MNGGIFCKYLVKVSLWTYLVKVSLWLNLECEVIMNGGSSWFQEKKWFNWYHNIFHYVKIKKHSTTIANVLVNKISRMWVTSLAIWIFLDEQL